jgi:hypothetical protein
MRNATPIISKTTALIAVIIAIVLGLGVWSAIRSFWSVLILLAASIGGLIVLLGLWVEKEADEQDKREHLSNFTHEKRRIKLKAEIGWWILIGGIVAEVVISTVLAGIDVIEHIHTATLIAANDPRKQQLNSVNAVATIFFAPNVMVSNKLADSIIPESRIEYLLHLNLFAKNGYSLNLYSDEIPPPPEVFPGKDGEPVSNSVSIHLSGDVALRQPFTMQWNSVVGATNLTAGQIADSDFNVSLMPTFLRTGTLVLGGNVQVFFNAPSVERDFLILPQWVTDSQLALLKCVSAPPSNAVKTLQK